MGEYSIDQYIDLVIADKAAFRSFSYDTTLVLLILKEAYNNHNLTPEVLRIQLLLTLEVVHVIEVHLPAIEL